MYYKNTHGVSVSALRVTSMFSISIYEEKTDMERLRFLELTAKSKPGNTTRFPFPIELMPTHDSSIFPKNHPKQPTDSCQSLH